MVAELDGVVVGMNFVKLTKVGEVWLQGGRVEKSHRREGIGLAMVNECLRIAREEMDARIARVITDKTNLPPQEMLSRLGFKKLCEFTQLEKKAQRIEDDLLMKDVKPADEKSTPDIWRYMGNSSIFRESGGLRTLRFIWYSLDEEDLARLASEGKAFVYNPGRSIRGVMIVDDTTIEAKAEKSIQTCYFDADSSNASKALASFLVNLASSKGLETVKLWTYTDMGIIRSLREIGFAGELDESTEIVWMKRL